MLLITIFSIFEPNKILNSILMETNEGVSSSPDPEPKIIGLTGGIGSGKTTVAKIIEDLGFPVYYSDIRAKEIVNENFEVKEKIKALLGDQSYNEQGFYNRKFVAGLVFENQELLAQLNQIIHPAVKTDFEAWIKLQKTNIVFKETALLFELELDKDCNQSLLVTAEDNLRLKRVMDRDGKTYREVENIMNQQMPEKDKIRRADYIIYNNNDFLELREETEKTIQKLIAEL